MAGQWPAETVSRGGDFEEMVGNVMTIPEARDAIMSAAGNSDCWREFLPQALWGVGIEEVAVLKPAEYLARLCRGGIKKDERIIVDGELQIASLSSDNPGLTHLPHMVVRGSIEIFNAPWLRSISCLCTGWLTMHDCPKLEKISGEVFSLTSLRDVGIEKIGADFRCAGNLIVAGCMNLQTLNCEAAGGVSIIGGGLRRTGAAFSTDGQFTAVNCADLERLEGRVGGETVISIQGTSTKMKRKPDCSKLQTSKLTIPPDDLFLETSGGSGTSLSKGGAKSVLGRVSKQKTGAGLSV